MTLLPPGVEATTNDAGYFRTSFDNADGSISTCVLEVKKPGFKVARETVPIGEHATMKIKLEVEGRHPLSR